MGVGAYPHGTADRVVRRVKECEGPWPLADDEPGATVWKHHGIMGGGSNRDLPYHMLTREKHAPPPPRPPPLSRRAAAHPGSGRGRAGFCPEVWSQPGCPAPDP